MKSTHTRSQLIIVTDNCSKCFFKRYKILSWYYISPKMWKCQISAKKKFPGSTKKVLHNFRWLLGNFWGCNLQKSPESYKECKIFFVATILRVFVISLFLLARKFSFNFLWHKKEEKILTSFVDHGCICFLTVDWKVDNSKKVFFFSPILKKNMQEITVV